MWQSSAWAWCVHALATMCRDSVEEGDESVRAMCVVLWPQLWLSVPPSHSGRSRTGRLSVSCRSFVTLQYFACVYPSGVVRGGIWLWPVCLGMSNISFSHTLVFTHDRAVWPVRPHTTELSSLPSVLRTQLRHVSNETHAHAKAFFRARMWAWHGRRCCF